MTVDSERQLSLEAAENEDVGQPDFVLSAQLVEGYVCCGEDNNHQSVIARRLQPVGTAGFEQPVHLWLPEDDVSILLEGATLLECLDGVGGGGRGV